MSHLSAIPDIYDTATNLGRWRRALDGLADSIGAKAVALKIRQPESRENDLDMLSTDYLSFSRSVSGIYYGLRFSGLQNGDWDYLSRQPVHQPTLDESLSAGTSALDARQDYAFLRRKIGVRRRMGVRLNSDRMWFDAVSVAFPETLVTIPPPAVDQLRLYLPHLTKAVELGRMFRMLQARYKAALQALDHVHVGLAVALPGGEVIVQNAEADRVFDARQFLWKSADGRLTGHDADAVARVTQAIEAAARTCQGGGGQSDWMETIAGQSSDTGLLVDVAPLSDGRGELERGLNGALITLIDPTKVPKMKLSRFAKLYTLTSAETEVCGLLLEGATSAEIAERRATSPVTTKNQISSILAKTGVNRRAELIRLLMRVMPPVS
jgi:DNA-binding CsgD family transcriptional regulator